MVIRTTTDSEGRRFLEDTATRHAVALDTTTLRSERVVFERLLLTRGPGKRRLFQSFAFAANPRLPRLFFGCPVEATTVRTDVGPRCLIPLREHGQLRVVRGLVPVGIFHPAARQAELLRDLRAGRLQQRRQATLQRARDLLRRAALAARLTPAVRRRLEEVA